jgi:hypothetical protein
MEPKITRLSDEEILHIFGAIVEQGDPKIEGFLVSFACTVCQATKADFYTLRPATLIFIAKYALTHHLAGSSKPHVVHNFPAEKGKAS